MHDISPVSQACSALQWPEQLKVFRVDSDSMDPFIKKQDYVVVDTYYQEIVNAVYALTFGGQVVIRRLNNLSSGRVAIQCDNPRCGTEEVALSQLQGGQIIGRVRYVEKQLF
jgi:phage repressor protein C with HTH and peptisase S24 domain